MTSRRGFLTAITAAIAARAVPLPELQTSGNPAIWRFGDWSKYVDPLRFMFWEDVEIKPNTSVDREILQGPYPADFLLCSMFLEPNTECDAASLAAVMEHAAILIHSSGRTFARGPLYHLGPEISGMPQSPEVRIECPSLPINPVRLTFGLQGFLL